MISFTDLEIQKTGTAMDELEYALMQWQWECTRYQEYEEYGPEYGEGYEEPLYYLKIINLIAKKIFVYKDYRTGWYEGW